jgi:hypothetical protein
MMKQRLILPRARYVAFFDQMAQQLFLYVFFQISYLKPSTPQEIYDYAGKTRKSAVPGGPDTYRSLVYRRNEAEWSIVNEVAGVP